MKRVKLTAVFLMVFGSLAMAPALVLIIGAFGSALVLGGDVLSALPPAPQLLIALSIILLAILYYTSAYMLLTYHRLGVRLAQLSFFVSITSYAYETIIPSLSVVSPGISQLPAYDGLIMGYRIANLTLGLFFLWLLKIFDEKKFRANYAIVSQSHVRMFDHLFHRKPKTEKAENQQ